MIRRLLNPLTSRSFFLFGARGTGKTCLLRELFKDERCLWINLLEAREEQRYALDPDRLGEVIAGAGNIDWVIIDEVQKVPKLLDRVHDEISRGTARFALTGSSARKLKRGGANLLAGRAFVYHLFPFTKRELGKQFELGAALRWGTLPEIMTFTSDEERSLFLDAYVNTYLKEEIVAEQLIRNLDPFRRFLPIAAQTNGTIVNYRKIADDVGANEKTVKSYFDICEDTLVGFRLSPFSRSIRKQQLGAPKFYLFDCGVKRALQGLSGVPLGSSAEIGLAFEHFVITEAMRLNSYLRRNYSFSYLATKSGLEIDLIIERPNERPVLIEIKSTDVVHDRHLTHLRTTIASFPEAIGYCFCNEPIRRRVGDITIVPWWEGLEEVGLG